MRADESEKQAASVPAAASRMARLVIHWIRRPRAYSVKRPGLTRREIATYASYTAHPASPRVLRA